FFSSRRRHTRFSRDWSSDVCSSDLPEAHGAARTLAARGVSAGDHVAIDSPNVLPWLLGADLLGAAALVVEPTWTAADRAAVFDRSEGRRVGKEGRGGRARGVVNRSE